MINPEVQNLLFQKAVSAIDEGKVDKLERLLAMNPELVNERLEAPGAWLRDKIGDALEGYFKQPYLLYFIADNPVRVGKLHANIILITNIIIKSIQQNTYGDLQQRLDYTLGLVATGRIPRESGVQAALIDLLIDAGAEPRGGGISALAHGNPAAAEHLTRRGGKRTLAVAACLDQTEEVINLLKEATTDDLQVALAAAAFYGKAAMLTLLLGKGVDINAFPDSASGFHSHATALHQAVCSGSADAVKVLIDAGANPEIKDRLYNATPLGWANYMIEETQDDDAKKKFALIAAYLRNTSNSFPVRS